MHPNSSETRLAGDSIRARKIGGKSGAGERTRTADLLITNQLLYQLSYAGNPLESMTYEASEASTSRRALRNEPATVGPARAEAPGQA